MIGFYNVISNPSGSYTFTITNQIGTQQYFAPYVTNSTGGGLLMEVNGGLAAQSRCNCVVPTHGSNVAFGYYKLVSGSNVRGYQEGSGYTGTYTFFSSLTPYIAAKTGVIRLTF